MNWRHNLLRIDGLAGVGVGMLLLLLHDVLAGWYQLPADLLFWIGLANLTYGLYSLPLSFRSVRPRALILLLVVANLAWAVLCVRWALLYAGTASIWGMAQFIGEAVFVGGLGWLEWRYRDLLVSSAPPSPPASAQQAG